MFVAVLSADDVWPRARPERARRSRVEERSILVIFGVEVSERGEEEKEEILERRKRLDWR